LPVKKVLLAPCGIQFHAFICKSGLCPGNNGNFFFRGGEFYPHLYIRNSRFGAPWAMLWLFFPALYSLWNVRIWIWGELLFSRGQTQNVSGNKTFPTT